LVLDYVPFKFLSECEIISRTSNITWPQKSTIRDVITKDIQVCRRCVIQHSDYTQLRW
jgi:hypothetical protein